MAVVNQPLHCCVIIPDLLRANFLFRLTATNGLGSCMQQAFAAKGLTCIGKLLNLRIATDYEVCHSCHSFAKRRKTWLSFKRNKEICLADV